MYIHPVRMEWQIFSFLRSFSLYTNLRKLSETVVLKSSQGRERRQTEESGEELSIYKM